MISENANALPQKDVAEFLESLDDGEQFSLGRRVTCLRGVEFTTVEGDGLSFLRQNGAKLFVACVGVNVKPGVEIRICQECMSTDDFLDVIEGFGVSRSPIPRYCLGREGSKWCHEL